MREENLESVISGIEKRANAMQHGAALAFFMAIGVLVGVGFIFYSLEMPKAGGSNFQFGVEVTFNLLLKLALTIFAFYIVRLIMSVVTYNLTLSNDLYSKSNSLSLFKPGGNTSLNDLYKHMSVNDHKFEASNGFSGQDEFKTLLSALNAAGVEPNKSSQKDADKAGTSA